VARQRYCFGHTLGCFFQIQRHITTQIRAASNPRSASPTSEEVLEDRSAEDISESFEDIRNITETAT
jgi:hypothetical protein